MKPLLRKTAVVLFARHQSTKSFGLTAAMERRVHRALLTQTIALLAGLDVDVIHAVDGDPEQRVICPSEDQQLTARNGRRSRPSLRQVTHECYQGNGQRDRHSSPPSTGQNHCGKEPGRVIQQRGYNFEARLLNAMKDVAELGFDRLVVVGSDTPTMTAGDVERAIHAKTVVVGPAKDGGVYLIGCDVADVPSLGALPWKKSGLLAAMQARFGARVCEGFATRRDIDDIADLMAQRPIVDLICRRWTRGSLELPSTSARPVATTPVHSDALVRSIRRGRAPPSLRP